MDIPMWIILVQPSWSEDCSLRTWCLCCGVITSEQSGERRTHRQVQFFHHKSLQHVTAKSQWILNHSSLLTVVFQRITKLTDNPIITANDTISLKHCVYVLLIDNAHRKHSMISYSFPLWSFLTLTLFLTTNQPFYPKNISENPFVPFSQTRKFTICNEVRNPWRKKLRVDLMKVLLRVM